MSSARQLNLKKGLSHSLCRSAFVLWVSMNIMILVVPRYGAYLMALTGLMMLFSDAVFWNLIPQRPLMIHIEVRGFPCMLENVACRNCSFAIANCEMRMRPRQLDKCK